MNELSAPFSVAILAGGQSRRMGTDKALLPLDGIPLIERVLATTRPLAVPHVLIANNPSLDYLDIERHPDVRPNHGPLGGLYTALSTITTPAVLLLACDQPFLTTEFLRFLAANLLNHQALVPTDAQGQHPLCALYSRSCLPLALAALTVKQLRLQAFLTRLDVRFMDFSRWHHFDPEKKLLANVNTPEEYRYYQKQRP